MFTRLGGAEVGALAHRRFVLGDTSPQVLAAWIERAVPLYTRRAAEAAVLARCVPHREVTANWPGGEAAWRTCSPTWRVRCPTAGAGRPARSDAAHRVPARHRRGPAARPRDLSRVRRLRPRRRARRARAGAAAAATSSSATAASPSGRARLSGRGPARDALERKDFHDARRCTVPRACAGCRTCARRAPSPTDWPR